MDFKIASFNVENLFDRPKVFLRADFADGDRILDDVADLQRLIDRPSYSASAKQQMVDLYQGVKSYVEVIEAHGRLFDKKKRKVVAKGRGSWYGFLRLKRRPFDDVTVKNTAQVIKDVNADVVALVEVENRIVLDRFSKDRLRWTKSGKKQSYPHNMLVDGNDRRGIDVGLLSKFPIGGVWSHMDDRSGKSRIFSRDCPEYELRLPNGETLWVLPNHLKSKGYGSQAQNDKRRKSQAEQIAKILADYDLSSDLVVIAGDLNDTPGSAPLAPLLQLPGLHDVLDHTSVAPDDRWTYHYNSNQQIDYLLVSDPLWAGLRGAGVFRKGIHRVAQHSTTGETQYSSVTSWANSASDHGCVWAELSV